MRNNTKKLITNLRDARTDRIERLGATWKCDFASNLRVMNSYLRALL